TGGNNTVTYVSDGRSREDESKKYGSGGLMQDKKYMLSFTYNCPTSEFNNPEGFFEGMSVDQANIALHKLFQFCGAQPLQSYSVHDIYKSDFNLEDSLKELNQTLAKNFA
ncbi:MAG: NAD(P)H-dependent oxidoreductase, partial [Sulfuricurvum sp.]|uniref:NAD(P)H-dependent oxidoreductase n=1 Tax=Sulfuricurvum sp. TaxID=2025608 RepID=UPI0027354F74